MTDSGFRSGYVALIGRPNVGKSTLLNHLLGQKLSITSRKPQTTRHTILGIKTGPDSQIVYVDTPGVHRTARRAMNRYMLRGATRVLQDVDAVVFVVEALQWTEGDELVLQHLERVSVPVILAVNKVDRLADKTRLLPYLAEMAARRDFAEVVPVSALRNLSLDVLEEAIVSRLPEGGPYFPEEQLTDRSERFLAAEIVREKLMRRLGQEIPYELTVEIESFEDSPGLTRIGAVIWVERANQKAIVIGSGGAQLKDTGRQAREDLERLLGKKVFLQLWVKVKEGWSDDERALRSLGYSDE